MHPRITLFILWLLLYFAPNIALASDKGKSMMTLNAGIVTVDEFRGVTYNSYMDIPSAYSGAIFFSYRYFITNGFAIGVSIGTDDVKGNLTYGNPKFNGTGREGSTGTYIRHTYTIAAPELFLKYAEYGNTTLYGYAGVGFTYSRVEKAYRTELYASAYQNGVNPYPTPTPNYLEQQNPVYINEPHFNGHITALGISIGKKVAWDLEIGFGYKGLINTGLSLKL